MISIRIEITKDIKDIKLYWNIRACIFTIHLLLNIFYTNNEYLSLHRNNKCKWLNNERITYGKNDNVVRKEKGKRQQRQVIRVEHSFDWKLEKSKEKRKRKNETPDEQCSRLSTRLSDSKFVHTIPGNRIERDGGRLEVGAWTGRMYLITVAISRKQQLGEHRLRSSWRRRTE